jgi:hypothetical protein
MELNSNAFENNGTIPAKYTCDGDNISPALKISGVPEKTKSLVLIMDDPDVPKILKQDGVFDHWVLFNISSDTTQIPEDSSAGTAGANGRHQNTYTGPCPPKQYEPSEHRYIFTLYAIDKELSIKAEADKIQVLVSIEGHVIAQIQLIGRYRRP